MTSVPCTNEKSFVQNTEWRDIFLRDVSGERASTSGRLYIAKKKKTTIIRIGRLKRSVAADSYAPKFQASPDDRLVGNVFAR